MPIRILVIYGPNLNMPGGLDPADSGMTLTKVNNRLKEVAQSEGVMCDTFQSDFEGEIIRRIGMAKGRYDALILAPAAYGYTSVALRDALCLCCIPTVEVDVVNPCAQRNPFKQVSCLADVVAARIHGFGALGFELALSGVLSLLKGSSAWAGARRQPLGHTMASVDAVGGQPPHLSNALGRGPSTQTKARAEASPPSQRDGDIAPALDYSVTDGDDQVVVVPSPMIGTFYRSPSPEASPFVEEGDLVRPGQILCIVEAMKLMNEVQAESFGKVGRIMVSNGTTVEYGQPLLEINKADGEPCSDGS